MTMKTSTTNLERILKRTIKQSELSQYRIGKSTGIDLASLSRFMSGQRSISIQSAGKLLDFFNLTIVTKTK